MKYDVFLICPVRNAEPWQIQTMNDYIKFLEDQGEKVYYPARDTDQNDNTGYKICSDNLEAIKESKEVHIFWDKNSQGTLFDLGIAFALEKRLYLVNADEMELTPHKSFANMVTEWCRK
jgi:nucleoside 2-deoxyribosyltransferase